MFKPLRPELLRGLEEIARAQQQDQVAIIGAYAAEALEHRGLATRNERGHLVLTGAGAALLEEHIQRGLSRIPQRR